MIKGRIEDSQHGKVLILNGELCIQDADEFRTLLMESIGAADTITMNVASVTEIDLSCLQLLCAAHRTAIRQNKSLELDRQWPESCTQVIEHSGYARNIGCSHDKNGGCMWIKEKDDE
jgi:ABC-type transporter Mla MlaB component